MCSISFAHRSYYCYFDHHFVDVNSNGCITIAVMYACMDTDTVDKSLITHLLIVIDISLNAKYLCIITHYLINLFV